jgi:DNA polymerase-3 subunit epsilon
MYKSMALYGLDYADLNIASRWECTVKFIKPKVKANKLSDCCREMNIAHHEALSDARACAKLYLMR